MPSKPETIDDYLAAVSDEQRAALENLRKDIRSAAPEAEEYISYGIPAFRIGRTLLVAFGVAGKQCSFYPGALPVNAHKDAIDGYSTSKGTIRFPANKPLPTALVRKLVKTRVAERGPKAAVTPTRKRTRKGPRPSRGTSSR